MIKNGIELTRCKFFPMKFDEVDGEIEHYVVCIDGYKFNVGDKVLVVHHGWYCMGEHKVRQKKSGKWYVSDFESGSSAREVYYKLDDIAENMGILEEIANKLPKFKNYKEICIEHDELVQKNRNEV